MFFIVKKDSIAMQNRNTSETDLEQFLKLLVAVATRALREEIKIMHMKVVPMRMLKKLSNDFI